MAESTYRTRAAEKYLLRNPNGPVGRHLRTLAKEVRLEAERSAKAKLKPRNRNKPRRYPGAPKYRGNFKAEAIRQTPRGPKIRVSNDAPQAAWLERGTPAHVIAPREETGRLNFYWEKEGRQFIGRQGQPIWHPGTPAYRIMENALDRVIKRPR